MTTGLREAIAFRLAEAPSPKARALASYLRKRGAAGELPCWGAVYERLGELLEEDEDWLALWRALVELGDRRALLLVLHAARGRPAVLRKVLREAGRLPVETQLTLVCLEELAEALPAHLEGLDPAARRLWQAGPAALAAERRLAAIKLSRLLLSRVFVPQRRDPAVEPAVRRAGGSAEASGPSGGER